MLHLTNNLKEKKRNININNNLAILPSHDMISQKWDNNPQLGKNVPPLRYSLRKSTHETRVPHRKGNIYKENYHLTDILRCSKWQQYLGKADPDMICRMLENAHKHIQAQPNTIPIGGVYYSYSQ